MNGILLVYNVKGCVCVNRYKNLNWQNVQTSDIEIQIFLLKKYIANGYIQAICNSSQKYF
jgi:hypothetical protein